MTHCLARMQTLGFPAQMRILILILINVPCTNENTGFYTLVDLSDQDGLNVIRVLLALRKISTSPELTVQLVPD